jgi:ankyrin repeat protein
MDLYLNIAKGESITHFLHLGANVNFTNDQCIQWNDQMHVGIFEPPGTNLQRTPLHAAVITNHLHTVTELLSHNANVDAKDTRQLTPLLLAANLTSRYPEFITTRLSIIHLLLHYNANPHLKGYMVNLY